VTEAPASTNAVIHQQKKQRNVPIIFCNQTATVTGDFGDLATHQKMLKDELFGSNKRQTC
jgi:glutaredoxin